MTTLSPWLRKFTALALLALAAWLVCMVGFKIVSGRVRLQSETRDLQRRYQELWQRRVDIPSLQAHVSQLASSDAVKQAAIVADSERAALARLQQIARKAVQDAGGQLLALNETAMTRAASSSLVSTQVRVRMSEPALTRLFVAWEDSLPRLRLHEFSIAARPKTADSPSDLELSAIVQARWLPQKGSAQ